MTKRAARCTRASSMHTRARGNQPIFRGLSAAPGLQFIPGMKRLIAFALFIVTSFVLSGCTFIGMGIGAAVPRYTETSNPSEGDTVRITTQDGEQVQATLDAKNGNVLTLSNGYELPFEKIRKMERRSNNLARGAAIGGVIDTVITVALVIVTASTFSHIGSAYSLAGM